MLEICKGSRLGHCHHANLRSNFQPKEDEEPFDGVLARTTVAMANAAIREGVPIVNVWLNSPANNVPRVIGDFEESGRIAAKHLMSRGFRRFGYLGFLRDLDSRHQGVGLSTVSNQIITPVQFTDLQEQAWRKITQLDGMPSELVCKSG